MGFLDFLDKNNHVLAKIDGDRLLDRNNHVIGKITWSGDIQDANNYTLGHISNSGEVSHGDNILEKDYKKAAEFYRKAADLNNPLSKMNLALMIRDGEVEGSDEEIERLVSEAAASDLPFMLSHGNYASDGI